MPLQKCVNGNLRVIDPTGLKAIFASREIEETWQRDHEAIKSVFGDGDKFGGVNPGDRRAIHTLVQALKPDKVLEVGTHIGASTLYFALALKANGNAGKVTTVDILDVNDPVSGPWKQIGSRMAPRDFANQLDCLRQIEFIAEKALDYMRRTEKSFDFIFLDGDHSSQAVYQEISAALSLLRPGGVILLHDYYPDNKAIFPDDNIIVGPFHALRRIMRECDQIRVFPLGRLPWATKQGSNNTSLALLTRATAP